MMIIMKQKMLTFETYGREVSLKLSQVSYSSASSALSGLSSSSSSCSSSTVVRS